MEEYDSGLLENQEREAGDRPALLGCFDVEGLHWRKELRPALPITDRQAAFAIEHPATVAAPDSGET
jgi:hypothetical protein